MQLNGHRVTRHCCPEGRSHGSEWPAAGSSRHELLSRQPTSGASQDREQGDLVQSYCHTPYSSISGSALASRHPAGAGALQQFRLESASTVASERWEYIRSTEPRSMFKHEMIYAHLFPVAVAVQSKPGAPAELNSVTCQVPPGRRHPSPRIQRRQDIERRLKEKYNPIASRFMSWSEMYFMSRRPFVRSVAVFFLVVLF